MAAFDAYPGAYQPTWWTTAATTTNAWVYPPIQYPRVAAKLQAQVIPPGVPAAKSDSKTNLEWLRERVGEVCALAELGV